jgi:alpha-L-rhamnosidase
MKHNPPLPCSPLSWRIPPVLLVACMLPCATVHGNESANSGAPDPSENTSESKRMRDRLSPSEFVNPPTHVRPGSFWDWLNGSITREQITRDLEAMKHAGMRGGEIWDVAAAADPDKRVPAGPAFLGPESTRLIVHAIREADRLGLEIGIVASSGWNAGGSWVPPEHAGKGLYQTSTTVTGPMEFRAELPLPELPKDCPRDATGGPAYLREVAVLAVPHDKAKSLANVNQVVDLTRMVGSDGKLHWKVPAGDWDIVRLVCTNHGQRLIVPSPNSDGPMIDFFDPRATQFHLAHIVDTILGELGRKSFEGTSFKTLEFDSMELDGFTPWNEIMAAEFEKRAGYPITRFLPLLAGWKLADEQDMQRFLHDWRKFVSDLLIDSHYATARKFLEAYGVQLIAESGGPGPPIWASNPVDGIKALGAVDIPRGEFWNRHRGIFLVKEIASAAHVYDKQLVDAESFTTWRRWIDGPLNHKDLADRALCEGLNCFSLHTLASSPPEAGLPGWAYHAGTDINPTATWWPMVGGLMDYLARCSYMLRQGWFVADVCYFYGDQAPNFHPQLCNVPEKPLLDGLDPRHDYDVCSSEVILQRMRVDQGRIVLPDGMSYAVLVLPEQDHVPSAVIAKVHALVSEGATVIAHQRPTRAPGIKDHEAESAKIVKMAEELWGPGEEPGKAAKSPVSIRPLGKGRFITTLDRSAALQEIGVAGDFEIVGHGGSDLGPLDFIHRKTADEEFYFVRNKTRDPQALTCRLRVAAETRGLVPEFWWPDSGLRSACHQWKNSADGRTEVPLALGPLGSVFVVFKKAGAAPDAIARDTFVAAESPAPLAIGGPWTVDFPEGWGAPGTTSFDTLQSWTESANDGIRFFSGIATYKKSFDVPESLTKGKRLFLELGDLAEIAEVTLNGKRLGLVWLPPYRIEISGAVRTGENQLEIRVANLWANRLNGDSLLPETERLTHSNLDRIQTDPTSDSTYGRVPGGKERPVYTKLPPLMKSGLFGPVRIISPRE